MQILKLLALLSTFSTVSSLAQSGATTNSATADVKLAGRPNVLFIAVDDLRPSLGCYGDPHARTPNIDKLASQGMVFTRAYCQQAVCAPSRASLLTGLRPDTTRIYDLDTHIRYTLPNVVTLPQLFKNNGYHSQAYGKIWHGGFDDPYSWTTEAEFGGSDDPDSHRADANRRKRSNIGAEAATTASGPEIVEPAVIDPETGLVLRRARTRGPRPPRGPSWEAPDVTDNELPDGQNADKAIATLRAVKDKPFFLAVGFIKPHLPFVAPRKYFDLFPTGQLPLAGNPFPPRNAPDVAMTTFGELRSYSDIPKRGPITDDKAGELVRAYYASTSYMDALVGKLLEELDRLKLRDKTIVILWGDHGWHLGEHALWCKHTNYEVATHTPLIISVPGQGNRGSKSSALVEFVDIYPTLAELASLTPPAKLEGTSFVPLIAEPERTWKKAAFSQYPRGKNIMGYSMKTERHRYTEWIDQGTSRPVAVELYDHRSDAAENENIALRADNSELTATLSRALRAGWQAARPEGS